MSQIYKPLTSGGPFPPVIATSYVTDVDSPAIPVANVLNVLGNDTTENNVNGIQTDGSSGSNTLTVQLTNRLQGTVTTTGLVTSPMITFIPTLVGTYTIEARVTAYNTTSLLGAGYSLFGSIRFDGVNSNICGLVDRIVNEEGAMSSANSTMTVSGASVFVNGVGYAAQTINWSSVALYTYVGA